MRHCLLLGMFILFGANSYTQEICDNAIDDDADGLIDLNDPDCECDFLPESGLIPNPSFEDTLCCPSGFSELSCAQEWIQASIPTTDFYHDCSAWVGFGPPEMPLPGAPGGKGYVGLYANTATWSEYAGACLLGEMLAGETYVLNFWVALGSGDLETTFSIFGTPDCDDLPWGGTTCPEGVDGWELLGESDVVLDGMGVWEEVTITFVPDEDIAAVAIGGSCTDAIMGLDYYFLDELTLIDSVGFYGFSSTGGWCSGDLLLELDAEEAGTFQWFKDGVALIGETFSTFEPVPYGEGTYSVMYIYGDQCELRQYTSPYQPAASFETVTNCWPESVVFENTSPEYLPDITEWEWVYGDGEVSEEFEESHFYAGSGFYDVSLIAFSTDPSCNDTASSTILVGPIPDADFEFEGDGHFVWGLTDVICENNPLDLINLTTVDAPAEIVSWSWDFGDGGVSEEENPSHTWSDFGVYEVRLETVTNAGCIDAVVIELYVTELRPEFTVESVCEGEEVVFVNTSDALIPSDIASSSWTFGDGGVSEEDSPSYTYAESGTFDVALIVTSSSGCKDTLVTPVDIYAIPDALFSYSVDGFSSEDGYTGGCFNSPVTFTDLSTLEDGSAITEWAWDFGDGAVSDEENPVHGYDAEGTYSVTLGVTSENGCYAEYTMDITMTNGVAFVSADTTICQNGTATIEIESSDGGTYIYDWSIPGADDSDMQVIDGLTEDLMVYVSSTSEFGCESPLDSILITVLDPLIADISPNDSICIGESAIIALEVNGGNGDYIYNWTANGEATSETEGIISVSPAITTEYCVTISDGCESTPIDLCTEIYTPQIPSFISDTTAGCEPLTVTFTDTTGPNPALNNATWSIDGETYTGNTVSHLFENDGTYDITLTVLSPDGCTTSGTAPNYITVYPLPVPDLYASPNPTSYFNTTIEVVNITPDNTSSFEWRMPGGSPDYAISDSTIEVTYPELIIDNYSVYLIETTAFGCVDSTELIIEVSGDYIIFAPNTFTPQGDGINDTWRVYIEGIDPETYELVIYNRWGQMIWQTNDKDDAWDAVNAQGNVVQDGVYVWRIQTRDADSGEVFVFEGTVNVLK